MKKRDILTMSTKEIDKLKVIQAVIEKRLKQCHAAAMLNLSTRQIRRLYKRVRREGAKGLIHGLRGRPSNRCFPAGVLDQALYVVKKHYADFGPTFANEKLKELHGLFFSTSTLRRGMIREEIWTSRPPKKHHRAWRERRSCVGMLVQLDGSPHAWFEGRGPKCTLLIFIDDATSRILYGEFIPEEDTFHLLQAMKTFLLLHGRPVALYVDKDSIYRVNPSSSINQELQGEERPLTQFSRAMKELNIEIIFAHSPQAKGRVERGFQTHQDRLVKELRLAGISSIAQANPFLQNVYIPKHNARFSIDPADPIDAHKPLLSQHNLDVILSVQIERVLANDFTLRLHNQFFQILKEQPVRVNPRNTILTETRLDGSVHLRFKDHYLNFKTLTQRPYSAFYTTRKAPVPCAKPSTPWKPPRTHPWKDASYKKMQLKKLAGLKKKNLLTTKT